MTAHAIAYTAFGCVAAILVVIGFLAARPRKRDEFDGGYSHDNSDVRITRVRGPYIVASQPKVKG